MMNVEVHSGQSLLLDPSQDVVQGHLTEDFLDRFIQHVQTQVRQLPVVHGGAVLLPAELERHAGQLQDALRRLELPYPVELVVEPPAGKPRVIPDQAAMLERFRAWPRWRRRLLVLLGLVPFSITAVGRGLERLGTWLWVALHP